MRASGRSGKVTWASHLHTDHSNEPGKPIMVEVHAEGVRGTPSNPRGYRVYHGFGTTYEEAETDALAQMSAFLLYEVDE